MATIIVRQNSDQGIRLLRAQAQLYTEAKRILLLRLFVSAMLAALAPAMVALRPDTQVVVAAAGGMWMLLTYLPFRGIQREKVREAAVIQEQFDRWLFDLPWNEDLIGQPVRPELILAATRRSNSDGARFHNWYGDLGALPAPIAALVCQRQNAVWDWRLQNHYARGVAWITSSVLALDCIVALFLHQTLTTFLLSLLIPTLPVLTQGVETAKAHWEIAKEKEETALRIETLWQIGRKNPRAITLEQCEKVQDRLFTLRSNGPLVPDAWYKWLQQRYQSDMDGAVTELRKQAETPSTGK